MAAEPQTPGAWRRLPRPVRWLVIVAGAGIAFVILLAIGLALATNRWIRPVVEEQASIAIPGEVSIGGLNVSLLGLNVTVDDLSIRPESPADAPPVIQVGRLFVSLARLPLLSRHIVVNEIDVEAPVVRVVREPSGEIDLLKVLVPETPPTPAEPAPPSAPLPVRVTRIELGTGRVEFTDKAQPGAERIQIEIPRSKIDNVIVTGDPGEKPSDLSLEVNAEGATIGVDGTFDRAGDALRVDATVQATKLPLARARVYLPDLGWSELAGELDAKIHYLHESGKKQTADGKIAVRGLGVRVPNLNDPALAFGTLDVGIDQLDLIGRRLALGDVKLEKLRVYFDPSDPAKVPLLPKGLPAPSPEPTPPSDAKPFAWSLRGAEIVGAELVPIGEGLQPLTLDATVKEISSASEAPTDVTLKLAQGGGSVSLEGKVRPAPLGFDGQLTLADLALAPLVRVAAPAQGALVGGGLAKGALAIQLGSLAAGATPASGGDLHVAGTLGLAQLDARSDAEGTIGARVERFELAIQSLDLPGLLPPPTAPAADAAPATAPPAAGAATGAASPAPETAPPAAAPATAPPAAGPAKGSPAAATPTVASAPAKSAPAAAPSADAGTLRLAATLAVGGVAVRTTRGDPLSVDLKQLDLAVKPLELTGALPPQGGGTPSADAGRLRVAGAFGLAGVAVKSGKEGEFGFELDKLELGVKQIEVPGLLAGADAKPPVDPLRVALERVRIATPKLRLTRTDTGIVLPQPPGSAPPTAAKPVVAAEEKPAEADTSAPKKGVKGRAGAKGKASGVEPGAPAASDGPGLRLEIANLAVESGSVRFVDRTVKPFYQGDVTGLTLTARDVSFPSPSVRELSLKLDAPGPAPIWAYGAYTAASSWFELNLEKLPLAPLNPYVRNASGYIVNGGELSLYTKGSRTGERVYAENWITLIKPDVTGGGPDAPLEKAVGAPVSLILALLKDPSGNIGLPVPIDYDASGASVRLGSIIGSALTRVLVGALTSPLKLLGAVVDSSGKVKDATPEPVHFVPGRVELSAGDDERVAALAKLAATRPGLVLRLEGQTSGTDGQFLREAKLLEAIDSGEGLPEQARGLGNTLVRRRLRTALEARLAGETAALEPEDAKQLEDWLAAVEVGPESLTELARKRSARVQELLQTQFGLDGKQIRQADPGPPGASPLPAVDVAIGS